jgi:hypothetical protein
VVLVNLNGVHLIWRSLRHKSHAKFLILTEFDALNALLWVLLPLKFGQSLASRGIQNLQVHVTSLQLRIVLLAKDDVGVKRGIRQV